MTHQTDSETKQPDSLAATLPTSDWQNLSPNQRNLLAILADDFELRLSYIRAHPAKVCRRATRGLYTNVDAPTVHVDVYQPLIDQRLLSERWSVEKGCYAEISAYGIKALEQANTLYAEGETEGKA
jgi:hypothetical protein